MIIALASSSADMFWVLLVVVTLMCLIALSIKRAKLAQVSPRLPTVEERKVGVEPPGYFERYLSYLADVQKRPDAAERTRADVEALLGSAKDGSGGCVNEILKAKQTSLVKGLVVGRIQSGKTQNYIGLMLKAIDEGFNVIVVLTSNSKELVRQTRNRIFGGDGELGAFKVVGYNDYIENRFFERDGEPCYDVLSHGKAFVGVAQKERQKDDGGHLPRIARWFAKAGEYRGMMKVLLIDDEADYASQNSIAGRMYGSSDVFALRKKVTLDSALTMEQRRAIHLWLDWIVRDGSVDTDTLEKLDGMLRANKSIVWREVLRSKENDGLRGKLYLTHPYLLNAMEEFFSRHMYAFADLMQWAFFDRERSAVNKSIVEMCAVNFAKLFYVGYTATPFANIANETPVDNPLYPDFVQSLSLSPEYFGFDRIFGTDKRCDIGKMDIVRAIPVVEDESNSVEITPTLKEAIAWVFCSAAARIAVHSGTKNERTTMLINIEREKEEHKKVKDVVVAYIAKRATDIDGFVQDCKEIWTREVGRFNLKRFRESVPDWPTDVRIRDWTMTDWPQIEQGVRHLCAVQGRINVVVLNSDTANADDLRLYQQGVEERDSLWIVCGGNKLSRGLTLEGLTVSYYDRVSTSKDGRPVTCVDTMAQMGRWFGYRNDYQLLPRIWMPKDALRYMKGACYTEKRLHEEIRKSFEVGADVSDPNHYLPLYACSQRLTGRDAALSTSAIFRMCGVVAQLSRAKSDIEGAFDVLKKFVNEEFGPQMERTDSEYRYRRFPFWKAVRPEIVIKYLTAVCPYQPEQTRATLEELCRVVNENLDVKWDIVIADIDTRAVMECADIRNDVDNSIGRCDLGEGISVRPSGAKEDAIIGDIVEYRRKTQSYLAYLAGYKSSELKIVDEAANEKYGEKLRTGARAEYRDLAYVILKDCRPKLQIFLVRPSDAVSMDKTIPLIKYAFEWPGFDRGEEYVRCVLGDRGWESCVDKTSDAEVKVVCENDGAEVVDVPRETIDSLQKLFEDVRLVREDEFLIKCKELRLDPKKLGSVCWHFTEKYKCYYVLSEWAQNTDQVENLVIKDCLADVVATLRRYAAEGKGELDSHELYKSSWDIKYGGYMNLERLFQSDDKKWNQRDKRLAKLSEVGVKYCGKFEGRHLYAMNGCM